jgi:hypothetical protein
MPDGVPAAAFVWFVRVFFVAPGLFVASISMHACVAFYFFFRAVS